MRTFTCSARYRWYLEASIALAVSEIAQDQRRRAEARRGLKVRSRVPDQFIDTTATGTLTILVGVDDQEHEAVMELRTAGART